MSLGTEVMGVAGHPMAGGYQATIPAAAMQRALSESASIDLKVTEQDSEVFRLGLARAHDSPELREATHAKNAGDFERALQLVDQIERRVRGAESPSRLDLEPILARGIAARVAIRAGQLEKASRILESTSRELYAIGQLSEAANDFTARLFLLSHRASQPVAAAEWLSTWRERLSVTPLNAALMTENEGMLERAADRPVAALRRYRAAALAYRRLGQLSDERRATDETIKLLGDVGAVPEALTQLERMGPPEMSADVCDQAAYWSLRAWLCTQVAQEGDAPSQDSVEGVLMESAAWQRRCRDPVSIGLDLVVQGLWWLHTKQIERATAAEASLLTLLKGGSNRPQSILLRTWAADLRGHIAIAGGQVVAASKHFHQELDLAVQASNLDPNLRAHIGLAAVAQRRGDPARADAELRKSMDRLDQAERWDAFGSLLHTQFSTRQRSARLLVAQLLARGDVDSAFQIGLVSHGTALRLQMRRPSEAVAPAVRSEFASLYERYLTGLKRLEEETRDEWMVPGDRLPVTRERERLETLELEALLQRAMKLLPEPQRETRPRYPKAGEYWLLLLPSATEPRQWTLLGRGRTTRAAFYSDDVLRSREATATHTALEPFAEEMRTARSIVVFPGGASQSIDFGNWLLDDRPLRQYRLAFGMGLASATEAEPTKRSPLVIADPSGDLPFARLEAALAAAALDVPADRVLLGKQASPGRVLELLPSTDFLHFAGHVREAETGLEPALVLAEHNALEAWELFGLRSVPRIVVLSACRAGDGGAGTAASVGNRLLQTLFALGADTVMAPMPDIRDEDALEFQRSFYRALETTAAGDVREAFWTALRKVDARDPEFRLFLR